jgi:signal peptidase
MISDGRLYPDLMFASVFTPLVIAGTASYYASRGNFFSVALISFVFIITPYISPILPNLTKITFSLFMGFMAFLSALILRLLTRDDNLARRKRLKRAYKYAKKPFHGYVMMSAILVVSTAFFSGTFEVYPIAVLSGSMEPTFSRGSLAIIRRVKSDEVYDIELRGEVIHFVSRNGVEYIHRVVDYLYDSDGMFVYSTKGDANDLIDPYPVQQESVYGVAFAIVPYLGHPYLFLRSIIGWQR